MHRTADPFPRLRWLLDAHVRPRTYGALQPMTIEAFHVPGEPIDAKAAFDARYQPFEVGDPWGTAWGTTWFRVSGSVPQDWAGRHVVAKLSTNRAAMIGFAGEALVWEAGEPRQGLSWDHDEYPVAAPAAGGETVLLHLEAAANPSILPHFGNGPGPVPLLMPEPDGPPLYTFGRADLAVRHDDVAALVVDLDVLLSLAAALGADDRRGAQILAAIGAATDALDLDDVVGTAAAARIPLQDALAVPASPAAHRISAVGHAHIDTAWLWPLREARRKVLRTFSTALQLMDEYPDYVFLASQPQHYAWIQESRPTTFERIRARVAEGRWEPVGAMWVEADCNLPSGESLVRQLVHGTRFFRDELGVVPREVWLPDVFGYPAQLPQIMRRAGITRFLTQKLSWNDTNPPPHSTFTWEGLDGSSVLAHFPPANTYNGIMSVDELRRAERDFAEHGYSERSLYPFGWGDGGGGPSRAMLERHARVADTEGVPRVVLERSSDFFDAVEGDAERLPTWTGELYFEKHRGTYTSQADVKAGNRWGEAALQEAELWSAFTPSVGDGRAELDAAWKLLLVQQFHDILPGSSIHWVYEDARRDHAEVRVIAHAVRDRSLDAIAADVPAPGCSVVLFNALTHPRTGIVVLDAPDLPPHTASAVDVHGVVHPVQALHDGRWAVRADLPSCGWATVEVRPDPAPGQGSTTSTVEASDRHLENDRLRVEWDGTGHITSIVDKVEGREVVPPGRTANVFQLQYDRPREYDAWDLDREWLDRVEELSGPDLVEVVDDGPLVAAVRLHWSFGDSTISQVVSLAVDSPVLELDTTVDWQEEHRLLKVAFPVDIRSPRATYEVQYGNVERSTHENTSYDHAQFEVCAHRWADLSEHDYGVALLNDCKYGYDIKGDVMRLSLLRSSTMPDPQADRGHHRFRYALLPHAGSYRDADVIQRAAELGVTSQARSVGAGAGQPGRRCLVASSAPGAVITAVKQADDSDDLVVRLYEAWGGRRCTQLTVDVPVTAARRADLLERPLHDLPMVDRTTIDVELSPFEIVTLLLTTA